MDNRMKLPDYFPYTTKPCKIVAGEFFSCFTKHAMFIAVAEDSSRASASADATNASTEVSKCEAEFKKYTTCMEGTGKTWLGYAATSPVSEKRFRVCM